MKWSVHSNVKDQRFPLVLCVLIVEGEHSIHIYFSTLDMNYISCLKLMKKTKQKSSSSSSAQTQAPMFCVVVLIETLTCFPIEVFSIS